MKTVEQNKMRSSRKSLVCRCVFAEEMHAEICYAECLLQKATLTFVQVRTDVCLVSSLNSFQQEKRLRWWTDGLDSSSFQAAVPQTATGCSSCSQSVMFLFNNNTPRVYRSVYFHIKLIVFIDILLLLMSFKKKNYLFKWNYYHKGDVL